MINKLDNEIHNNRFGDYYAVMLEVFSSQGMNYQDLEDSMFEYVSKNIPGYKDKSILDIGIGDGASVWKFIKAGCRHITGIDVNLSMLQAAKEKFGDSVRLVEANALDMGIFKPGDFPVIISGACVHNIPKKQRGTFWKEIVRLNPEVFIMVEKVMNDDEDVYQVKYQNQIRAFDFVLRQKRGKEVQAKEWIDHLASDEPEKIELEEVVSGLKDRYKVEVIFEMGIFKTVACRRISS